MIDGDAQKVQRAASAIETQTVFMATEVRQPLFGYIGNEWLRMYNVRPITAMS